MVQRYSKQKGSGPIGWMRSGTSRSVAGKRKGLAGIESGKSWFRRSKRRDFSLSSGTGVKTKFKFKGDKMKLITKDADGNKIATKFKIKEGDREKFMARFQNSEGKALKGDALEKELAKMQRDIKSGSHGDLGLTKVAKVEYGNKKLRSLGLGRKRSKATHIKYKKGDDGSNIINTVSSKSGSVRSKSKYKYGEDGKLKTINRSIKDKSEVGNRLGFGKTKIKTELNDAGRVVGIRRSRGRFSRAEKTKILRNDDGEILSYQTRLNYGIRGPKKIGATDLANHNQKMGNYFPDGIELKNGKFTSDQMKVLKDAGHSEKAIKNMEKTQRFAERAATGNSTRISTKLSKKYGKKKKGDINKVLANNNVKTEQIRQRSGMNHNSKNGSLGNNNAFEELRVGKVKPKNVKTGTNTAAKGKNASASGTTASKNAVGNAVNNAAAATKGKGVASGATDGAEKGPLAVTSGETSSVTVPDGTGAKPIEPLGDGIDISKARPYNPTTMKMSATV